VRGVSSGAFYNTFSKTILTPCLSDRSEERPRFIVSSSDGTLAEWGLGGVDGGMERMGRWKAHDFEAWTVAYDGWNANIVYSGEMDCVYGVVKGNVPY
jgi:hypothetical protein